MHSLPSIRHPEPLKEDLWITQRMVKVGKLIGIPVLDHVIVAHESYKSFADQGIL
jgi:DNA repair protein RadC